MRQLLVLAIETDDALDIDHLQLTVPGVIANARAYGTLLADPMGGRAVAEAAKTCLDRLPTEQNVMVGSGQSAQEIIRQGLDALKVACERRPYPYVNRAEREQIALMSALGKLGDAVDQHAEAA